MDRKYIGRADGHFTLTDERRGYSETRRHLAGYSDEDLQREYHEATKAGFNQLFGHNARAFGNLVVDELRTRGITQLPNIFGPIEVRPFRR
jgi:hypothetical protein